VSISRHARNTATAFRIPVTDKMQASQSHPLSGFRRGGRGVRSNRGDPRGPHPKSPLPVFGD
jgi:hypothetical protein